MDLRFLLSAEWLEDDWVEASAETVGLASDVVGFVAASVAEVEAVVSDWVVQVA